MIPPNLLVISQGWGLIHPPLRASNEGLLRPRVARAQKIIRAPSPPLFREQEDDQATLISYLLANASSPSAPARAFQSRL